MGAGALSGGLPERAFSPEEAAALRQKLWPLLARQAGLYTGCGSSSLPEDTARELLCSLCYTLKVWFQAGGAASQPLADADLEAGLRQGQAILEQKCRQARRLWMAVRHSAPDLKNRALADTLDSIGAFFQRYDLRFFAHCIPCDIDYPLCRAVPEALPGVDYILAYLDRLGMEHALLRPFAPSRVRRLLAAGCPDPVGLLVNLCEPVLANAVGLTLLGRTPGSWKLHRSAVPVYANTSSRSLPTGPRRPPGRSCPTVRRARSPDSGGGLFHGYGTGSPPPH